MLKTRITKHHKILCECGATESKGIATLQDSWAVSYKAKYGFTI